jgi:beta-barrel assembly-enhancing protease
MKLDWRGDYFDGHTAARHEAWVRLTPRGLEIVPQNREAVFWPYPEIRRAEGHQHGEPVRLERGAETFETLLVDDPDFLPTVRRFAPDETGHFHGLRPRRVRIFTTLLAAAASVAIVAALYLWGIPALATAAARYVPIAWEERLGEAIMEHLAPAERRCTDAAASRTLDAIVAALIAPAPDISYRLRVFVVKESSVNALAAPGGFIVVYQGLLERTKSAEELAGVLAHEAQHVLKRHATRALLEQASTRLLLSALLGDIGGLEIFGLESARVLGILSYSRRNEQEADAEGMRMVLEAGIDPQGMIAFFESMNKLGGPQPQILAYLSTHPSTEHRIERLKSIAAAAKHKPKKLLPEHSWKHVRTLCSTQASRAPPPESGGPS